MIPLGRPDALHLKAAEGWLELGNWREANKELDCIAAEIRAHPDVLHIRTQVYAKAGQWEMSREVARALVVMVPENASGWILLATSQHKLHQTSEAERTLVSAIERFPRNETVLFELARFACVLNDIEAAWKWLERAFDAANSPALKLRALNDPDFKPLWNDISEV